MMLMPASAEFAALCQSQLAMMAALIGADTTAVYLAESWSEQAVPKLLPIAVYPGDSDQPAAAIAGRALPETPKTSAALLGQPEMASPVSPGVEPPLSTAPDTTTDSPPPLERLAIPMMHEGGVFGVLVGWRTDRPWRDTERDRLEECARSLTLACVLDQRGQWLKSQMSSLDRVQAQQSDRFHELLHQLRSPLTALKTFGKLLTKRLSIEDPNRRLVTNLLRESDRMQELLGYFDDTLQAADDSREATATPLPQLLPADESSSPLLSLTSSSGSLAHFGGDLTPRPLAIAAVVQPLVELTQALAEDADMNLWAIAPVASVQVQADPRALTEILSILIDNALKYASPGSQIWIEWGLTQPAAPGLTGILLGDTGPGIPPEDQAHIFERHYRGLQAAGELAGSGLGLAIAADLIHEMQGHIDVFSPLSTLPFPLPTTVNPAGLNHGTAFVIWLPSGD